MSKKWITGKKIIGLKFSGNSAADRYNEYMSEEWIRANVVRLLAVAVFFIFVATRVISSLDASSTPIIYAISLVLFGLPMLAILAGSIFSFYTGIFFGLPFKITQDHFLLSIILPSTYLAFIPLRYLLGKELIKELMC